MVGIKRLERFGYLKQNIRTC
jgi:hypothetical protein